MAAIAPQPVQIRCQNCQTPFTVPVWSFIDVGAQPELKGAFIAGQVNMAACPNCGMGGMLATPFAYHDPGRQSLFVLVPQELNLSQEDAERFVGEVSNMVMSSLPADAPRGYVLTPRRFFSMQSLLETVLEGEGISKEMLAAQRERVMVLSELAGAYEADLLAGKGEADDGELAQVVERHKDAITYEFFMTLGSYVESALVQGREESAQMLATLRDRVIALSGFDAAAAGLTDPTVDELIAKFRAVGPESVDKLIAQYRPLLEDEFWDTWESQLIDESDTNHYEFARMTLNRMDDEAQVIFEGAANLLRAALEAEDPKAVLTEHSDGLNEAFMLVLEANISGAMRAEQHQLAETIAHIRSLALQVLDETMTPHDRLISQLLRAESSSEATKLLRKNMALVNSDFVTKVNDMMYQFDEAGRADAVERLRQVARESASLLF